MNANDIAGWLGAITGTLSLCIEAYDAFKNRAQVKIKLSSKYVSVVTSGNYLQQDYSSNIEIVILNIEFINKGQQEVTLNDIRAYNFSQKAWVKPSTEKYKFKLLGLKKLNSDDPTIYSFGPTVASSTSLPLRVKANDMKVFQISVLADECLKNNRVKLRFDMPNKNKKVKWKISNLSDFIHSKGYKLN